MGLKSSNKEIYVFFIGFILIHLIFLLWDLFCIPSDKKSGRLVAYDFTGLALSTLGFIFLRHSPIGGVICLWAITFAYYFLGYKAIAHLINNETSG
jgi:hypothetical protein